MNIEKYKSPGWKQLKDLNAKEIKLIIINIILVAVMMIASIIVWSVPAIADIGVIILLVITIPLGIWSFVNFILFVIIKVKQFSAWGTISQEEQNENQNIFIFLILSIFFAFIFTTVLFYTFKNMQFVDNKNETTGINDENLTNSANVEKTLDIKTNEKTDEVRKENISSKISELKDLKELLDSKLITQEEFDTMKAKILAK